MYDTILRSTFVERITALAESLGVSVEDWLAELEKTRARPGPGQADHRRRVRARRCAASASSRRPDLVADLVRRDAEFNRAHTRLYDDTRPVLRAGCGPEGILDRPGQQLRRHHPRAARVTSGVIPLVDAVVLSCEVGSAKPSPEIYVTALADLGVAAADAVFIDDQPTFCVGAEAVGVRPIQIARDGVNPINGINGSTAPPPAGAGTSPSSAPCSTRRRCSDRQPNGQPPG